MLTDAEEVQDRDARQKEHLGQDLADHDRRVGEGFPVRVVGDVAEGVAQSRFEADRSIVGLTLNQATAVTGAH